MAMRAILWSFGGAEQDEAGNVAINSKNTIEALKYMRALYQESETSEVFTWTPPLQQPGHARRPRFVCDERHLDYPAIGARAPTVRRIAAEHLMNCYVIWQFAENKEGAQQFLMDYMEHFHDGFEAGQFHNLPCFPSLVPDLKKEISNDPRANPADKYKVLGDVLDWATNVGYPGYASAAIDEAFKTLDHSHDVRQSRTW